MEIPKIERYVSDLLTVSGFSEEGAEHHLWVLLHHLYSAVAMYEQLSAEDKEIIAATQKKLKYFFESNCKLKERKRRKNEKANNSPTTPLKEKENKKEIEVKTPPLAGREISSRLEKRRQAFRKECLVFVGKYDSDRLADFFNYWSEESHHAGKMRFEAQRFWNMERRLARWMNKSYASEDTAAAIRLRKTKKKEVQETTAIEQQETVAAERQLAQQKLEQQQEASKQGAVSYEEWLSMRKNMKH